MYKFTYADNNMREIVIPEVARDADVISPKPSSIEIATAPNKTSYDVGEYLDMSGLVVRVHFDDNTNDNIIYNGGNAFLFSFEPSLNTALNENHAFVTITYRNFSVSIPISVSQKTYLLSPNGSYNNSNNRVYGEAGTTRIGKVIDKNSQNSYNQANENAMNLFLWNILTTNIDTNAATNVITTVPNITDSIPEVISKYIQNNPMLFYIVNPDGSYAFSNGMIVYPNGVMLDVFGNIYYTDGTSLTSNGLTQYVNGSVRDASGTVYNLDGTINLPDNSYIDKNGVTHYSDGSIKLADGTIYNIDGTIDFPNGTVVTKSGRVIKRTKKAVETEEKEKNKAAWRYDPASSEWHVELGDGSSTYYK